MPKSPTGRWLPFTQPSRGFAYFGPTINDAEPGGHLYHEGHGPVTPCFNECASPSRPLVNPSESIKLQGDPAVMYGGVEPAYRGTAICPIDSLRPLEQQMFVSYDRPYYHLASSGQDRQIGLKCINARSNINHASSYPGQLNRLVCGHCDKVGAEAEFETRLLHAERARRWAFTWTLVKITTMTGIVVVFMMGLHTNWPRCSQ